MSEVNLKILSDIQCNVYVDNEFKAVVNANVIHKVPLSKGEYWVQLVAVFCDRLKIEQIVSLDYDKVLKVDFLPMINEEDLVFIEKEKCYRNTALNIDITPRIYDEGSKFVNGIAKVKTNGRWGCIDKTGNVTIPCNYLHKDLSCRIITAKNYDAISAFVNGLAQVCINGKYGCINQDGIELVSCIYDGIGDCYLGWNETNCSFHEGLAIVCKNKKGGVINKDGVEIVPCIYDVIEKFHNGLARVQKNNKWGFINKDGEEVVPCAYKVIGTFNEGLAVVRIGGKYGYIDKSNRVVVPCVYKDAEDFQKDGLARVQNEAGFWGYVNARGEVVIRCGYDYVSCFNNGVAIVEQNKEYELIDSEGVVLTPCMYDGKRSFTDYAIIVYKSVRVLDKDGRFYPEQFYGFMNNYGEEITPCVYTYVSPKYHGFVAVRKNGKWGLVDKFGKEVAPCEYDEIGTYSDSGGEIIVREGIRVRKDGKFGFLDNTGKEIVPCIYDSAEHFSEGLARVRNSDDKYGFVNKFGEEEIPCVYDNANFMFSEGLTGVKKGGKWGCINKGNKVVIPFVFDYVAPFENGTARILEVIGEDYELSGRINMLGEILVPCRYSGTVYPFKDDVALVSHSRYGMGSSVCDYGYVNKSGDEVLPCIYDEIKYYEKGKAVVEFKGKSYYINIE